MINWPNIMCGTCLSANLILCWPSFDRIHLSAKSHGTLQREDSEASLEAKTAQSSTLHCTEMAHSAYLPRQSPQSPNIFKIWPLAGPIALSSSFLSTFLSAFLSSLLILSPVASPVLPRFLLLSASKRPTHQLTYSTLPSTSQTPPSPTWSGSV